MEPSSAPLFPCLKPHDWDRRDTVCRPLWDKPSSEPGPWLAFGYDHPQVFEFLRADQLTELHTSAHELEMQAIANLRTRHATWEDDSVDVDGAGRLRLLVCADDFLAAERILDADFMRQAQTTMRAATLVAGIPRRGVLMVTPADQDQKLLSAFSAAVKAQFSRAESAPISPLIFAVSDGVIVAAMEDVGNAAPAPKQEDAAVVDARDADSDDAGSGLITTFVARNDQGQEDVHLLADGVDGAQLAVAIETIFAKVLKEHIGRAEFSGHIQIVVLDTLPRSERKQIPPVIEHLRGICSDLTKRGQRCRVSVTYEWSAPPALSTQTAPAPVAPTPTPQAHGFNGRRWFQVVLTLILVGLAGWWYASGDGFPASIEYGARHFTKATGWSTEGISGAVFVGENEHLPTATVQIGVMTSSRRPTADRLDAWIREQYAKSPADKLYDSGPGRETCKIGVSNWDNYGYTRTFVAVQVCKTGNSRAVCAEDDEPIGEVLLRCGILTVQCFESACDSRRLRDRDALGTLVDRMLAQR